LVVLCSSETEQAYRDIVRCLESFQTTHVFETFHAFGDNNALSSALPDGAIVSEAMNDAAKRSTYLETMLKATRLWNIHLLRESMDDCAKIAGRSREQIVVAVKLALAVDTSAATAPQAVATQLALQTKPARQSETERIRDMLIALQLSADFVKREQLWRNWKVVLQIASATDGFQFVLADQAFAAVIADSMDAGAQYSKYAVKALMSIDARTGYTRYDGLKTERGAFDPTCAQVTTEASATNPVSGDERKPVVYYRGVPRAKILWDLMKYL
jgi:hypothetical protein